MLTPLTEWRKLPRYPLSPMEARGILLQLNTTHSLFLQKHEPMSICTPSSSSSSSSSYSFGLFSSSSTKAWVVHDVVVGVNWRSKRRARGLRRHGLPPSRV
ncbi:hypothetical protein RHMOL_Rhmol07G0001200 [Rhododendron molle]|uniref:Uncharacterized protein n=1 Tax=Rhododendron molle TaxID=49168 RepID=A0ACC0MVH7_RHOML|nr:hypothetical protein RHMOL_Rhmol07G0001200 [Rhododendron molle]